MEKNKMIQNCSNCGFKRECSQNETGETCTKWLKCSITPMIYIASALKGDLDTFLSDIPNEHHTAFTETYMNANLRKAEHYTRLALDSGVIPITPHLYFANVLDDTVPEERRFGMDVGISWLLKSEALWFFGPLSTGMKTEIKIALDHHIPVFSIDEHGESKRIRAEKEVLMLKFNQVKPMINLKINRTQQSPTHCLMDDVLCYFPEELESVNSKNHMEEAQ